jgi:putrescine:ornithine antiporter
MASTTKAKKMSLMQLTFIVAVNMMGSGIIMLPTNMAQVGAISLLSWIVTAIGSMAIAYGFAQCGLFNQRAGGMAAYAEDAYGKAGYFNVFFMYFLSLAIANVAIGISAVGYLAAFIPWLSSTPIATCIGVIALLWLTTVANFGGPGITGKIGAITVWGVILPVGFLAFFGWFWFSGETFKAAWNPQNLPLSQGMVSSISLTLWAFLGMESAAQNSAAVENPKRDVPLACLFGTLGAAVVYILSTAVIQGIVPNAELAASTGPFGLAYAKMFSPEVGQIVMALAVMACLGSLLGWQFTLAQTAKSGSDERMFPAIFSRVNAVDAPVAGMIVLGIVQTGLALMTISPTLSEQFSSLVNLAVVTNVVPYIIALSALPIMMAAAKVPDSKYNLNMVITTIGILYSIYAVYASGGSAVMGGMLVMVIGFLVWGFIAPRFSGAGARSPVGVRGAVPRAAVIGTLALLATVLAVSGASAASATLDRIKSSGKINLGYEEDARPFSYAEAGKPSGFSVGLCGNVSELIKTELKKPDLAINWVAVKPGDALKAVQQGTVDLLCSATTASLAARRGVSFSIPIFPSGVGAVLNSNSDVALQEVLSYGRPSERPVWRGMPARTIIEQARIGVIKDSNAEQWLSERLHTLQIPATVDNVATYQDGIDQVKADRRRVLFGSIPILLDTIKRSSSPSDVILLSRRFSREPLALALARSDEDFRLLVDTAVSRTFAADDFAEVYGSWFGPPDEETVTFYRSVALPE